MINTIRALKISVAWTSVVYTVCFLGVALFPGIRPGFMEYALHTRLDIGENVMTLTTFITGLVIWNVIAALAAILFAVLANYFRD